jgi:predicted DCC family thiol-disulfide oxidoreductase YuxK
VTGLARSASGSLENHREDGQFNAMPYLNGMGGTFFYDGECGLCAGAVDFLRRRDKQGRLEFSPLQSPEAAEQLPVELTAELKTAVFRSKADPPELLVRSDAVLGALREVGGIWRFLARVLRCIPRPIRDGCYEQVAANRQRCSLN